MNIFSIKVQEFTHSYVNYTIKYNNKLCELVDMKTINPKASVRYRITGNFLRMVIYTFAVIQDDVNINLIHVGENKNTGNRIVLCYKYNAKSKLVMPIHDFYKPRDDPIHILLSPTDVNNVYINYNNIRPLPLLPIPETNAEVPDKKQFLTKDNYASITGCTTTFAKHPPRRIIMKTDKSECALINPKPKNRQPKLFGSCVIS